MNWLGKCNSDKCHCSRCQPEKLITEPEKLITERELDAKIDNRINRALLPVRERIDHVSHMANARINRAVINLGERIDQSPSRRDHVFYSIKYHAYCKWVEVRPGRWRKMVVEGVNEGEFVGPDFASANVGAEIHATEHTEVKTVGALGHSVTDRVEFTPRYATGGRITLSGLLPPGARLLPGEKWAAGPSMREIMTTTPLYCGEMPLWRNITTPPEEGKPVDFTVSMFELSLLAWRASHGTTPYPRGPGLGNPMTVMKGLKGLEVKGLIKFGSEDLVYTLTPRAECLIEAMASLPLPVKAEPPWAMPTK